MKEDFGLQQVITKCNLYFGFIFCHRKLTFLFFMYEGVFVKAWPDSVKCVHYMYTAGTHAYQLK